MTGFRLVLISGDSLIAMARFKTIVSMPDMRRRATVRWLQCVVRAEVMEISAVALCSRMRSGATITFCEC